MLNINQVIIAGIISNDLELRTSNMGNLYCRFNVGTTEEIPDNDGNPHVAINWHRCIVQDELAEELVATCQKGTNIHVSGNSKSHFFDEGNGMQKEVTEAVITAFQVVSGGKEQPLDLDAVLSDTIKKEVERDDTDDIPY